MNLISELDLPDFVSHLAAENPKELLYTHSFVRTQFIEWLLFQAEKTLHGALFPDKRDSFSMIEQLRLALLKLQVAPESVILPFLQCNSDSIAIDEQIWCQLFILALHRKQNLSSYSTPNGDQSENVLQQVLKLDSFNRLRRTEVNFDHFLIPTTAKRHEKEKELKRSNLNLSGKSSDELLQLVKDLEIELRSEIHRAQKSIDPIQAETNPNVNELTDESQSTFNKICHDIESLTADIEKFDLQFGGHEIVKKKQSKHNRSFSKLGPTVLSLSKAQNGLKQHLELNRRLDSAIRHMNEKFANQDDSFLNESRP